MNEKLNQIRQEKKKAQILVLFCTAGLLVSLVLTIRRSPLAIGFYAAVLIFYLVVFRRQSKRFQQTVKTATLTECLRPYLKNITYQEKNGLETGHITQARLLPVEHPKSILIRDTVRGTYQALPVFLSDVTVDYQTIRPTKSGDEKSMIDFLSGNWFEIQLKEALPFSCTIWDKKLVPAPVREQFFSDYRCSDICQPPAFREQFSTYTRNHSDCSIPEELEKALLKLAEATPGQIAVQLDGQVFRIFIRNRFLYTHELSPKIEATAQLLTHNQYPEISYILRAADAVRGMV